MVDNSKDIAAIFLCVLTAYFVATSATVPGVMLYGIPVVLCCAGASFMIHWIVAIPSLVASSEKYFDFTGMVATLLLVATSIFALLSQGEQVSMRSTVVAVFVSIWTLRLGTFLYIRIVKSGEDKRFREIKKSLPKFLMTWTLSALWVFLTTANAITIIVLNQHVTLDLFFIAGLTLWVLGFVFEAVADKQKKSFSEAPENKDKFITLGLWSISRHPNYFGEIVLWTGIAIISLPLLSGWQFLTLVSPVFVYLLLTKISGLPFLEAKADKKWGEDSEYLKYKKTTPILFPFFGKK